MSKRWILAGCMTVALGLSGVAGAHDDPTGDDSRCDTWYRPSHGTDDSHEHSSGSDINELRPAAGTEIHGQSGHYVVRNDFGYVEVVGGQSYRGPSPSGVSYPGQGGYVQGEVDVAQGVDGDFNIAFFGPNVDDPPAASAGAVVDWTRDYYGRFCVAPANDDQAVETRRGTPRPVNGTVTIANLDFSPNNLSLRWDASSLNDVTFRNSEPVSVSHDMLSGTPGSQIAGDCFNTSTLAKGQSQTIAVELTPECLATAATSGASPSAILTIPYYCRIHPAMRANILIDLR